MKVHQQFADAVEDAFDAGFRAGLEARAELYHDAYLKGFLTQLIYQDSPSLSTGGAEEIAKRLLKHCKVLLYRKPNDERYWSR